MTLLLGRRGPWTAVRVLGAALVYPLAALVSPAAAFGQGAPPAPSGSASGQPAPPAPPPPSGSAPAQPAPPPPAPAEPAPAEDEGEVIDVEEAPPPVPADKGVITGTVVEASNGEAIIEAQVSVVGTKYRALTDLDGNYRLELPPGAYELRVFYEGHKPRRVQKVVVAKGQSQNIDVTLEVQGAEQEIVREIEVTADRSSAATQILIRKNAANVGDSVSAQEIAKTPDRNAAEAAKRVVGATVLEGRFVFVRGLGERYTNALLNGSPLPSPEPDRQAIPLDLFPSLVLSDISVLKTFTPDMPGDFAGGSVSIHTRQPTETLQVAGTLSLGFNTETTFRDRLSYTGSNTDFLGIDSGKRALPRDFPRYKLIPFGPKTPGADCDPLEECVLPEERAAAGRTINSSFQTNRSLAPPNHSASFVISGTADLGGAGKLGATAALTYSRKFTILQDATLRRFVQNDNPEIEDEPFPYKPSIDSTMEVGNDQVSWGGLAVVSYSPSNDHRFIVTGLTSRFSDNEARYFFSEDREASSTLDDTRLRFVSRGLYFGEIAGEHKIRALKGMEVNYRASLSIATLDEPHTREVIYTGVTQEDGSLIRAWDPNNNLSGSHFFASQSENAYGGSLDVTQPILTGQAPLKIKAGAFLQLREREFAARRFHFRREDPPYDFVPEPDALFSDANMGRSINLEEWTRPEDQWTSTTSLYAGYLMADFSPLPWLRAIGGARVEAWSLDFTSFDLFDPENPMTRAEARQETVNALPSVGVVFKTSQASNLRASFSRTVARPQLRELSPVQFVDFAGQRVGQGNPFLKVSDVTNADLRFELFPGAADVFALSAFYKTFDRPIEALFALTGSSDTLTFCNTESAMVLGMEVEAKKNLGFLSPYLSDLSPLANVTVSSSRVDVDILVDPGDTGPCSTIPKGAQTSAVRPLVGQSPLVLNVGVDYTNETSGTRARLVYNVSSPRIRSAGANGLLDVYEQPRHLLDLAIAQKIGKFVDLKLTAENLLQEPLRYTFGKDTREEAEGELQPTLQLRQQPGTTFNLSVTFTN